MQSRSPPDRANNLEIHLPFRGFQDFVLIIKRSLFYRADYVVTVIGWWSRTRPFESWKKPGARSICPRRTSRRGRTPKGITEREGFQILANAALNDKIAG